MKDSVILGSGNSRYLKSVADFKTLYPTYDDFVAALVAGTLPVDFNGINTAGFQQVGDALGKNTLLKDATAALFGLTDTAVPDDVLALIKPLIDGNYSELSSLANSKARIDIGSYVGTGDYFKTLTFPQLPKFVFIHDAGGYSSAMFISIVDNVAAVRTITSGNHVVKKGVISGNSISWTMGSSDSIYAMNANKTTYYWISIT